MGSLVPDEIVVSAPGLAHRAHAFTDTERRQARALASVLGLQVAFFVVEVGFAWVAKSDVLIADSLHLLADMFALGVALFAMRVAVRRPTARFTYGLRRAEPIAAIVNAVLVLGAIGTVVAEAIADLRHGGAHPHADLMLYVSVAALGVNAVAAWLIHGAVEGPRAGSGDRVEVQELTALRGHAHGHTALHAHPENPLDDLAKRDARGASHAKPAASRGRGGAEDEAAEPLTRRADPPLRGVAGANETSKNRDPKHGSEYVHAGGHALNLRGAWLHLFGDALASLATVAAALLLEAGSPPQTDPIATFVVAAIVAVGAFRLLREAALVLLEAAPQRLPVAEVRRAILAVPGVAAVHSLHIWTLGAGHDAVTAHVEGRFPDPRLGPRVARALRDRFRVQYATVQVEIGEGTCDTSPRSDAGDP